MLDLDTYRRRIGCFMSRGRQVHRLRKEKSPFNQNKRDWCNGLGFGDTRNAMRNEGSKYLNINWKFAILLLTTIAAVSTTTEIYTARDSRTGKNRQRRFLEFAYNSEEEKKSFNKIRGLENKLVRASSHLEFFHQCKLSNVYPANLDYNGNFCLAFSDYNIQKKMKNIDQRHVIEKMDASIAHFRLSIAETKENIAEEHSRLKSLCNPSRCNFLLSKLKEYSRKVEKDLEFKKEKKLRKLTSVLLPTPQSGSWLPLIGLSGDDRKQLLCPSYDLDDFIINIVMTIIGKDFPMLIMQPPSLFQVGGYVYCPHESIQIAHNGAHHWLLLSSLTGEVTIYDSLNTRPTDCLKKQMIQLFSPDDSLPAYRQVKCQQQVGSHDCGMFAIAFAIELLVNKSVHNAIFDQSMMRTHLVSCLEKGKITPFPKYCSISNKHAESTASKDSPWKFPRRSLRLKEKQNENIDKDFNITLSNRFIITPTKPKKSGIIQISTSEKKPTQPPNLNIRQNLPDVICNLSDAVLSSSERKVLEKGFNFSPTVKTPSRGKLLDDLYAFCRKLRLKEFFYNPDKMTNESFDENESEKCFLDTKCCNPYFNPPRSPSNTLSTYISAIKKDVSELLLKDSRHPSNMTPEERQALKNLGMRKDIITQSADKGGKVVIMKRDEYIKECNKDLANSCFYEKLNSDNTDAYETEIKNVVDDMKNQNMITDKDSDFLTGHFQNTILPIFYGLPKIHKAFTNFPPLRPIVSNIKSSTRRLSEYLDSFLKYQAKLCPSYIRDTKHFLQKLASLNKKGIPHDSILVTMDVCALYTNIDHEEGAEACFKILENRKKKTIPSKILKSLILLVLKCNAFRFGKIIYKQVMGTCMGTPMAPNYANLFMDRLERNLIDSYHEKTGFAPLVWYRYIDDIFFIWTHGPENLNSFIEYTQNFSDQNNMKSRIRFEVNQSTKFVNFLDVSVLFSDGVLKSNLFSKPTDAFLYLNSSSNHPKTVIENIPKGQFIRIRRICTDINDFFRHCDRFSNYFMKRGYERHKLTFCINEVAKIERNKLLEDSTPKMKDPQVIFVSNWHKQLSPISSILKKHFHILQNDRSTVNVFKDKPMVAFRQPKSIRNFIVRNDISPLKKGASSTKPCGNCMLCPNVVTSASITNEKQNISIKTHDGGDCNTKELIYAAKCKKHQLIYVGHTGELLRSRFSKHRYDIKSRPGNSDLAKHFHENHDNGDMEVSILQTGLTSRLEREYFEDRWMCRLQSIEPDGINSDINQYAREMYQIYKNTKDT